MPSFLNFFRGMVGSTGEVDLTLTQRFVRVDAVGRLEVVAPAGAPLDVNLAEVAGTATVEAGINGVQAVGGPEAAGALATGNPILIAGQELAGNTIQIIVTDAAGRTQVVGDTLDSVADSGTGPVKVGAVADNVPAAVADGQVVHLITDLERFLRVVSKAYDTLTASDKVSVQNTDATDRDESAQTIADVTNVGGPVTVNYPSDAGYEIGNRDFPCWVMRLNDVTSVAFEVSNDGTIWVDATACPVDCGTGLNGYAAAHFTSAAGVNTDFAVDWEKCRFRYIRWAVTFPNNTNAASIKLVAGAI